MAALQGCFTAAMARNSRVQGQVTFALEVTQLGRLTAKISQSNIADTSAVDCISNALASAAVPSVSKGSRVLATIVLDNPVARLGVRAPQERRAEVTVLPSGMAETKGASQAGEVRFSIKSSAGARAVLAKLGTRATTGLAGLFDCRRHASHRNRPAEGTVTLSGTLAAGKINDVRVVSSSLADRRAPGCVRDWLTALDVHELEGASLDVSVSFAR